MDWSRDDPVWKLHPDDESSGFAVTYVDAAGSDRHAFTDPDEPVTRLQPGTDNGTGTGNAGGLNSGHGLIGIRERVAVAAGSVDVGQGEAGGFVVRVQLPYAVVT